MQACQAYCQKPTSSVLLHPWSWPTGIWQHIQVDFAGPFLGQMFLLVIDDHSKVLELFLMTFTTSIKIIDTLKSLFVRYGLPEQIVSDNSSQFTSDEFKLFCKSKMASNTLQVQLTILLLMVQLNVLCRR